MNPLQRRHGGGEGFSQVEPGPRDVLVQNGEEQQFLGLEEVEEAALAYFCVGADLRDSNAMKALDMPKLGGSLNNPVSRIRCDLQ